MKQLLAAQEIKFPNLYQSLRNALYPLMSINATGIEDKLFGKSALQFSSGSILNHDGDDSD